MTAFFVTATGTDIGKTFVTAGLIRHLRMHGQPASAIKPVVSGFDMAHAGRKRPGVLLAAMDRPVDEREIGCISPWRFEAPLSPDMAAAREGRDIDFDELVQFSRAAVARADGTLFIEGVGASWCRSTTATPCLTGWRRSAFRWIVVTGSYLGTISHTLTAVDVLERRDVSIKAVVINETENGTVSLADTEAALSHRVSGAEIVTLPRGAGPADFVRIARILTDDRPPL